MSDCEYLCVCLCQDRRCAHQDIKRLNTSVRTGSESCRVYKSFNLKDDRESSRSTQFGILRRGEMRGR